MSPTRTKASCRFAAITERSSASKAINRGRLGIGGSQLFACNWPFTCNSPFNCNWPTRRRQGRSDQGVNWERLRQFQAERAPPAQRNAPNQSRWPPAPGLPPEHRAPVALGPKPNHRVGRPRRGESRNSKGIGEGQSRSRSMPALTEVAIVADG